MQQGLTRHKYLVMYLISTAPWLECHWPFVHKKPLFRHLTWCWDVVLKIVNSLDITQIVVDLNLIPRKQKFLEKSSSNGLRRVHRGKVTFLREQIILVFDKDRPWTFELYPQLSQGSCHLRFSGFCPLKKHHFQPFQEIISRKSLADFPLRGGWGYPPFPLRKKTFFFSD